jgi:hypothetical protein
MRRAARLIAITGLGLALWCSTAAAASAPSCPSERNLATLRFAATSPTAAAPATMILPASGRARVLFKAPAGASKDAREFRAFEVASLSDLTKGQNIPILAIDPAAGEQNGRFQSSDSVALTLDIPDTSTPWLIRSFAVVACDGDAVGAWGRFSAPVSSPKVSWTICGVVFVLAWTLGMNAIFANRKKQLDDPLATKYPAVFAARPLEWRDFFNPIHFAADAFNQGSVQKLQVVVFSVLIGEMVLLLTLETGALTDLSPTVIALLGISGVGAATAQAAYQQRTRLSFENWSWLSNRKVLRNDTSETQRGPFWRDLVITNREFDVYKLQTLIFSVAVVAAIVVGGEGHLSTFSVPDTLLGILGLSQVVYVGGVLVKPPSNADLDAAITKLRAAGDTLAAALAHNTDTDDAGKLLTDATGKFVDVRAARSTPGANALRQYKALEAPMVDMIESALGVQVNAAALDWAAHP